MTKETKRERFIRVAESRTNKIIDMIQLLANCANKSSYEYDEDDIKQMFGRLDKELKSARNRFLGVDEKDEKFKFKKGPYSN